MIGLNGLLANTERTANQISGKANYALTLGYLKPRHGTHVAQQQEPCPALPSLSKPGDGGIRISPRLYNHILQMAAQRRLNGHFMFCWYPEQLCDGADDSGQPQVAPSSPVSPVRRREHSPDPCPESFAFVPEPAEKLIASLQPLNRTLCIGQ